jgi:uncharacterized protein involved in tellurium resistance
MNQVSTNGVGRQSVVRKLTNQFGPYSNKNKFIQHEKRNGYAGTNPPVQSGEILTCSED